MATLSTYMSGHKKWEACKDFIRSRYGTLAEDMNDKTAYSLELPLIRYRNIVPLNDSGKCCAERMAQKCKDDGMSDDGKTCNEWKPESQDRICFYTM